MREGDIIQGFLFYSAIFILGMAPLALWAQVSGQTQQSIQVEFREIALVELIGEDFIELEFSEFGPEELDTLTEMTVPNSTRWINYTTLSDNTVQYRISLLSPEIPEGFVLAVVAQNPAETGGGNKGTSRALSPVPVLNGSEVILVDEIKSSYTGVGENNGVALKFQLKKYDVSRSFRDIEGHRLILQCEISGYQ